MSFTMISYRYYVYILRMKFFRRIFYIFIAHEYGYVLTL